MSNIQKAGYIALVAVGAIWVVLGVVAANIAYICMGLAYAMLVVLCWSKHDEAILYEDLYNDADEIAMNFRDIATKSINHASEVLDSNKKLIKGQEDLLFLVELFLDGIDDEVADVMNEEIKDRGMRIRFHEGEWKLFVKRDE